MNNAIAFRADDFGLCEAVNFGVAETVTSGANRGVVKNVSMQANGLAAEHAARLVRELMPGVCLGVHVSLNCEWTTHEIRPVLPASAVGSLVDSRGVLLASPMFLHERKASVAEMLLEAAAQIARLHELGLRPRYMDAHMGVSWLHDWDDPAFTRRLEHGLRDLCSATGLRWIDDVPGIGLTTDLVEKRLENPSPVVRVVGHPALSSHGGDLQMRSFAQANQTGEDVAAERDSDRRMFTSDWLTKAVEDGTIRSVAFVES